MRLVGGGLMLPLFAQMRAPTTAVFSAKFFCVMWPALPGSHCKKLLVVFSWCFSSGQSSLLTQSMWLNWDEVILRSESKLKETVTWAKEAKTKNDLSFGWAFCVWVLTSKEQHQYNVDGRSIWYTLVKHKDHVRNKRCPTRNEFNEKKQC